jgi:hypothetical protein
MRHKEVPVKRVSPCRRFLSGVVLLAGVAVLSGTAGQAAEPAWVSLFDGQTLTGWKVTDFGGPPEEVHVDGGNLILEMGAAGLSGVTSTRAIPKVDYEVSLDAMRQAGSDFFCTLTFPVQDTFCSLVVGGWGGTLVGLSSLDGMDASQNETTRAMVFENGRWYAVRLRVTAGRIQAWIGSSQVVDARPGPRRVSVRSEMENCKPLGLSAWHTKAALKNIRLRGLTPEEIKAAREE